MNGKCRQAAANEPINYANNIERKLKKENANDQSEKRNEVENMQNREDKT